MDMFDCMFRISNDWKTVTSMQLPIFTYKNSRQWFNATTPGKNTNEHRLMTDIMTARQSCRKFEITGTALVSGKENPTDGLSNFGDNGALMELLTISKDLPNSIWWIE